MHGNCALSLSTMNHSGLKFIIIGASVCGLGAAISLRLAGHSVTVLEKDSQLGGSDPVRGPTRPERSLSPSPRDLTAALVYHRTAPKSSSNGVSKKRCAHARPKCSVSCFINVRSASAVCRAAFMGVADDTGLSIPDLVGVNRWNDEMLSEARGVYAFFKHRDLINMLFQKLMAPDANLPLATVVLDAEVVEIDVWNAMVSVASGETYSGDAIIGADGAQGFVRRYLMLMEEEVDPDSDTSTGMAMYSATIPRAEVLKLGYDGAFEGDLGSGVWMGNGRAAMTCWAGNQKDYMLWIYTPDNPQKGSWSEPADIPPTEILGSCDKCIQEFAELAGPAACVQVIKPYPLDSWVSESGRLLAIGDAAHPIPAGGLHPYSVALEDGCFLGQIFSHTRDPGRIPDFFRAFNEHREPRCTRIRDMDQEYVDILCLPDGEMQEGRDALFRANQAAGRNAVEGDMQKIYEDYCFVFAYDARDDADEWWINWGRHADRASTPPQNGFANMFHRASLSVVEHVKEENDENIDGGMSRRLKAVHIE
ncbi:hypothetical protein FB45DRAFT_931433 [Roridomyces roridus]|uniref:FAD-binding domain-containing protein n=1 Tax=Roridomyces roridus TaxID=1738132 RepID=A0AAD7FI05_9AGAR|nr:hypothetical protein FB45DRAFT_931433 [Roridomyces roridus]